MTANTNCDTSPNCDYDGQALSEPHRICWHLRFYRKIPRFRFHFYDFVSLIMEGYFHLPIKLTFKYHLSLNLAVPPTANYVSRCPHQSFQLKGDDTGAHTNQIEQEYRDVSPCHDTETMCFLHNCRRPILFNNTKFSAEAWNCLNSSAEILGNIRGTYYFGCIRSSRSFFRLSPYGLEHSATIFLSQYSKFSESKQGKCRTPLSLIWPAPSNQPFRGPAALNTSPYSRGTRKI